MNRYLKHLSDEELIARLKVLVRQDCELTAELVAHLAEVDERKLYLDRACSCMYIYCRDRLGMSDGMAYKRIQAARTSHEFPAVIEMLASGELYLCGVCLLAPHLTPENHLELFAAAKNQSKRKIDELLAERFPKPDVATPVRKLPEAKNTAAKVSASTVEGAPLPLAPRGDQPVMANDGATPVEAERVEPISVPRQARLLPTKPNAVVAPLSAARYKVQFTASQDFHDKLRQTQDLLRHQIPDGDIPTIMERALDLLLEDVQRKRFGKLKKKSGASGRRNEKRSKSGGGSKAQPTKSSRYVPAEEKRKVVERDGFQCSFVDDQGRRCQETAFLEFQHDKPVGKRGQSTADNVEIFCHAHNQHEARREFGAAHVERKIREARQRRQKNKEAVEPIGEPTPVQVDGARTPGGEPTPVQVDGARTPGGEPTPVQVDGAHTRRRAYPGSG
jgi:hypothetical protein